ncbi:MurR/RpiR family transcriptional regulator [Zavarzinia sp.]|uniref:MurR/RpiR family transcriptional regulator n=1 Tax=Zavarzinia sp. TaxID=2027920 RepID=UPI003BB7EE99
MNIRDRLTGGMPAPTPAETRLSQALLTDYPLGGIGTASALARKAGVSDPTVTRFVAKLGFANFADFQAALLAEVEAGLHSPLLMMGAKRGSAEADHPARAFFRSAARQLGDYADRFTPAVFDPVADLLLKAPGRIHLLGGRFSRHLASILAAYLSQFRDGVIDIGPCSSESVDRLADMGKRDVLVVFDYRRYQGDVVELALQAAGLGVKIVLFTDPWMSPVARHAAHVIVAPVEIDSPFDSQITALAQVEVLGHLMISRDSQRPRARMERIERIRRANRVTLDGPAGKTRP